MNSSVKVVDAAGTKRALLNAVKTPSHKHRRSRYKITLANLHSPIDVYRHHSWMQSSSPSPTLQSLSINYCNQQATTYAKTNFSPREREIREERRKRRSRITTTSPRRIREYNNNNINEILNAPNHLVNTDENGPDQNRSPKSTPLAPPCDNIFTEFPRV